MNNFFVNIVRLFRANLPRNVGDPLLLVNSLMNNRKCSFNFKCVHPDEVAKIIENFRNSKSCGSDNIDTYIIKLAKDELVPLITHMINLYITQPVFLIIWKTSIHPVFFQSVQRFLKEQSFLKL